MGRCAGAGADVWRRTRGRQIDQGRIPRHRECRCRVHQATQRRGMFTRLRGDVYNLAPCYVIEDVQIDRMVQILGDSIDEVLGS